MKTSLTPEKGYSLLKVAQKNSRLAYVVITTDISSATQSINEATALIFEDMLLSGTTSKSREVFLDSLKRIGATLSISVNNQTCSINVKALDVHIKKALNLTFEALTDAVFSPKELKRAIKTALNQLEEAKDNSSLQAHLNLKRSIFSATDRRYETTIEELLTTLPTVAKKDLQRLQKSVQSNFWYVTVGGAESTCNNIEKQIKQTKKTARAESTTTEKVATKHKRLSFINIPSRQNIDIGIGSVLPINFHHQDYPALVMGLAVLGKWGGFAGRLMSTVREKEGLTYGIYAKTEGVFQSEHCYWRIFTFFAPDKAVIGLTSTFREIKKIYEKGITDAELKMFKTILHTAQALSSDSLDGYLSRMHYHHIQGMSLEASDLYKARLQSVTKKEVNDAIKKYLNPDHLTISCAGPIQSVKKDIETFAKTL